MRLNGVAGDQVRRVTPPHVKNFGVGQYERTIGQNVSVYIDQLAATVVSNVWPYTQGAHMFILPGSAESDLHAIAKTIGLKRSWFQNKRLPHYDCTKNKRNDAIKAGAEPVDWHFTARASRAWRLEIAGVSMKTEIALMAARKLADKIVAELVDVCDRVEIAGSIRRHRPTVGDIEIVAIAKMEAGGLFGDKPKSLLMHKLSALVADGRLVQIKGGDKYRQYEIPGRPGLCLDLFIVRPETWGVQFAIRTGPASFSKTLVTNRTSGGRLQDGLKVDGGRVWRGEIGEGGKPIQNEATPWEVLHTDTEKEFMSIAGGWIDPKLRR